MNKLKLPQNPKFVDLSGSKFGRLKVIAYAGKRSPTNSLWRCLCECGKVILVQRGNIFRKNASCGCYRRENLSKIKRIHGMRNTRQYRIWAGMKTRCTNPKSNRSHIYYERGISYDPKWKNFTGFWSDMKNGYRNDLTLERKNNNLGYSKSNCKWATYKEQANNRRNNKLTA